MGYKAPWNERARVLRGEGVHFMVEGEIRNGVLGGIRTNYDGELPTTRLDEPDIARRQEAEDFVVEMLERSHMYKV